MDASCLRRAGLAAIATMQVLGWAWGGAFAQSAPATADNGASDLQEITVTGTRIKRPNLDSASPLTVLGAEELRAQGTSTVEGVLNRLPQFTADSNENGSNGSDGTARLNLRDLGASRVLVLVDGQRMLPVETADVNFIPSFMVERVDVVTGGASAVYGSDAVAGVVNFILRKDLQGVRFDAQYGKAQHENDNHYVQSVIADASFALPPKSVWDGGRTDFSVALGSNTPDGLGNATFYLGYRELQPVTQDSRDYSACALNLAGDDNDAFACGGSSNNQWGSFVMLGGPNNGATFNNTKDGVKTWVPYDSSFLYNYAPTNYIQRSDRRTTAGAFAHYDYNSYVNLYGSLMFMDDHTFSQAAPSAYFQGTVYPINCDNPLLSAQQAQLLCGAAAGTAANINTFIGYRFGGNGAPRRDDLRHTDYRLSFGSRGAIAAGWSYDASLLASTIIFDESYKNDLDLTKGARGLQVVSVDGVPTCKSVVDGSDPSCVPVDVFAYNGISSDAYGYIFTPTFTHGVQKEKVYSAAVNGDLGEYGWKSPWAASSLAVATGVEHREEDLSFEADAVAQQKGTLDNAGDFSVTEAYLEADVPLAAGLPFVRSLTFNTGYRYSRYDISGGGTRNASTYKFELQYAPVAAIKFRGSYNRAVRAPNITELFQPQTLGNVTAQDPCSGPSPSASLTACQRSGVSTAQYGLIPECPADVCVTLTGGNLALRPEVADTQTFGFVLTPQSLPGLALSADYFDIHVDGYINPVDASTVINQCIQAGTPYFCGLFHRDPASGVLFGTNGYISAQYQNTGFLQTSGVDASGNYRFTTAGVPLDVALIGTWLNSRKVEPLPGLGTYNCAGLFGLTCGQPTPTWRHNARVRWTAPSNAASVSANWRYFGSTRVTTNTDNPFLQGDPVIVNRKLAAYSYFDIAAAWKVFPAVELRAGVNNVLDKGPPAIAAGLLGAFGNGNTYPGVYDPMGRLLYAGISVEL